MNPLYFTTPPGWPDPPEGFLPPADWRPDPSWPPAPKGFQFYYDPFGYPTPPPPENWQPWASTDWGATGAMPVLRDPSPERGATAVTTTATRRRRLPRWLPWLVGLLVLALLAGGGWYVWRATHRPLAAPKDVSSISKLYDPALQVGTGQYQFAQEVTDQVFTGTQACIPKANAAVKPAKQTVAAGSDRGWTAVSWRFTDAASAQKAWTGLAAAIDGCTASDYTIGNPVHSPTGQSWIQYQQTAKDGTDHGRVVLTTDANTLTWIEGGRTDMGETAFTAIRKRLATLG